MAAERRTVEVVADWAGLGGPVRMGLLHATPSRGKEIFSFEYAEVWLASKHALLLDPSLRLHQGHQHAPVGRDNFGVFLDSSPDRWGRVLMQRREAQLAREDRRRERSLLELDYLLGVYDGHRLGALRFRRDGGPFLDDNTELASPPWTSLRELEQASLHLERDGAERPPVQQVAAHAHRAGPIPRRCAPESQRARHEEALVDREVSECQRQHRRRRMGERRERAGEEGGHRRRRRQTWVVRQEAPHVPHAPLRPHRRRRAHPLLIGDDDARAYRW